MGDQRTATGERKSHAFAAFLVCSIVVHGAAFAGLASLSRDALSALPRPIELVTFEVVNTPPPPPPPPVQPEIRKPPVKATPKLLAVKKTSPTKEETPPPNDPAPEKPNEPVPLSVGISMSSTTTAGGFSAPVGNTLAGVNPTQAPPPSPPLPSGPEYIPIYEVDTQPVVVSEFVIPYPEDLRRRGIEGAVVLRLAIDDRGNVTRVRVLKGPGYGLDEAAREAAMKLRFKPATKRGQAVATELTYTYRFELY